MINHQFTNSSLGTVSERPATARRKRVLMLLTNAFDPDPRVHQEARALVENGYDVTILCWDRDYKVPADEMIDGIRIERIYVRSTHGRGSAQAILSCSLLGESLFPGLFGRSST